MSIRAELRFRFQDWAMGWMDELREESIGQAYGDVLEVGFGTGLNLPYYTAQVQSLAALEPTGALRKRIQKRIDAVPFPVERYELPADGELPFRDEQFDCVVSTWTLCTIPDPNMALEQMHRVLKRDGKFLFMEHGRSPHGPTAAWQDRLNPYWLRACDGCNLNRDMFELVRSAGFNLVEFEQFYWDKSSRILSEMYRGVGTLVK